MRSFRRWSLDVLYASAEEEIRASSSLQEDDSFMFTRKALGPPAACSPLEPRLLCKQAAQRQPVPVPLELPQSGQLPISLGTHILNSSPAVSLMLGPSHPQRRTCIMNVMGPFITGRETFARSQPWKEQPGWDFPGRGDYHGISNKDGSAPTRTVGEASRCSQFKVCRLLQRQGHCQKGNFI